MLHTFPAFEIDENQREFRARGRVVRLQPKVFDLLSYLATHRNRVVPKDELLRAVWPGVIVSDGSLQRAISLARSALEDAGVENAIRTFPRQGYRMVVGEGIAKHAAAGVESHRGPTAAQPEGNSIAVLAFLDMSPGRDHEYFSDGIAEELLNLLAKVPQLRVIARTSSFSFKGKDTPVSEIARRLDVAHVLEGSVRRSGDRVRVTAQLIRAADSAHIWSETFERTFDDIFAVQDEIARGVVQQLEIKLLGGPPRVEETDSSAYALYLRARQLQRQHSEAGYVQALELLRQALKIDAHYAPAWDLRASILLNQASKGLVPTEKGYQLAREATGRALASHRDFAPAHGVLGWIALFGDRDFSAAARHYTRALTLAPTDLNILVQAAGLMLFLGRVDQAIAIREFAASRDPANAFSHASLGGAYRCAGRHDDALAAFRRAFALSPGMVSLRSRMGLVLLKLNRLKDALSEAEREPTETLRLLAVATIKHAMGDAAGSDAALARTIGKYEPECAYNIARVLAFRGEADRAFKWLAKAVEYRDPGLAGAAAENDFKNISGDPRWLPFLRRIGAAPGQLAAVRFEVRLPG